MTARHEPPPNPLAVAAWVAGTVAGGILLWISVDLFLVACVFAALIWVAVAMEQRDEATDDTWHARFETAVWKKKAALLEDEAVRLHLLLTEAERKAHRADCCDQPSAPGLHVIPRQRAGEHDSLPVADGDFPVHTVVDDDWLELLVTRPVDGPTS